MADGKQWIKLYTKSLNDPDLCEWHNQTFGVWARMLMLMGEAGTDGTLTMARRDLLFRLHLSEASDDEINTIFEQLKSGNISIDFCNGKYTVTVARWQKYQTDSTSSERVRKWRNTQNVTVYRREEKRREKKRREKNIKEEKNTFVESDKITFDPRMGIFVGLNGKSKLWAEKFPGIDVPREIKRAEAWALANPKNRKSNWDRFIVSWLSRAQDRAPTKRNDFI